MVNRNKQEKGLDYQEKILQDSLNTMNRAYGRVIKTAAENTEVRLAYLDRDFRYIWVNPSYARGAGYNVQQLIGKNHFDLFPNNDHRLLLQKVIETGQRADLRDTPFKLPFQPESEITYCDVKAVPIKDAGDKISGLVLTVIEATERKNNEIKLERAAREWREIFDNIADFVSIHDVSYKLIRVNRAFSNALNMKPRDIIGKTCYELLHNLHGPLPSCPHRRAIESKTVCHEEFFEPSLGIFLDTITSPLVDEKGKIIGTVHVARNITKRKIAEKALLESERRYRELVEKMHEGIWVLDKDANTTYINPRMAEILGYSIKEMEGKSIFSFMDERSIALAKKKLEYRENGDQEKDNVVFIKRNGSQIYAILTTVPVKDEQGNSQGSIVVLDDITLRKRMEDGSKETLMRYRIITENMGGGVLLFEQGKGVYANDQATEILGYSREELLNMKAPDFVVPEERKQFIQLMQEKTQSGAVAADIECWLMRKGGERRFLRTRYFPVNEKDQPPRFFILFNDITALKLAETKLQELYKTELELRQKLEDNIQKRALFTHALVHELRTPLTPIMNSSEMLLKASKEKLPLRLARNVYDGALILANRIEELLDLARIEVGTFKINLQPVEILRLVQDTINYMQPQVQNKTQTLSLQLPKSLPPIMADKDRLKQILMNLIANACKYSPPESKIVVRARRERNELVIEVEDNGPGINPEIQRRLFEPYFRADTEKDNLAGLGLGLPISKNIVELHGGRMWVKSQVGKGSIFGFSLPLSS